jgi:osmoprotectant transport system substrate-binding protein
VRRPARRLAALVVAAGLLVGGCGGSGGATATTHTATTTAGTTIRIGSKNFTEQTILGQLYRQALQAKGYHVVLKPDIGSSELIHRALRRGVLDMYPEYIGVLLSEVAHKTERPPNATAAYRVAEEFENSSGFSLLTETPFADTNALAVKPAFARQHGLRTIADLRKLKGTVKVSALAEFETRYEGLVGLAKVYGLRHLRVVPVEDNGRYSALDRGRSDVASVFTTESQLAGTRYDVLGDPRRLFASGHVAPLISDKVLATHGTDLRATIDAVTRTLTTQRMRKMNAEVVMGKRAPAKVATAFLHAQGLL